MKQVSTTQLAKSQGMSTQGLFTELAKRGLIEKEGKSWALTTNGKQAGGEYRETTKYGTYIVWPESMNLGINQDTPPETKATLTATAIGRKFELSANKINFILSEIGWLSKGLKGWVVTKQGRKQGGSQAEDIRSGVPYVRWPESILSSKTLKESVGHVKGTSDEEEVEQQSQGVEPEAVGFREKFEAEQRCLNVSNDISAVQRTLRTMLHGKPRFFAMALIGLLCNSRSRFIFANVSTTNTP